MDLKGYIGFYVFGFALQPLADMLHAPTEWIVKCYPIGIFSFNAQMIFIVADLWWLDFINIVVDESG